MSVLTGDAPVTQDSRRWSRRLGYAGLLPFAPALILFWIDSASLRAALENAVLAYAAVILAFVGALHWHAGLHAASARESTGRLVFSVLPALLAWVALLLEPAPGFALLIAGFLAAYGFDRRWPPGDRDFLSLRRRLTAGAAFCLSAGLVASLAGS